MQGYQSGDLSLLHMATVCTSQYVVIQYRVNIASIETILPEELS